MSAKWLIYFLILAAANVAGITGWKRYSRGDKYLIALLFFTLVCEATAYGIGIQGYNNWVVYHIFNPIEFLLVSLYFNSAIDYFRKRNLGVLTGLAGVLLSVLNTLFLQSATSVNSNFLMFESTAIVIYCLLSIHQILLDEEHLPYRFVHFWITLCCLVYWSSTFTGWGFYAVSSADNKMVVAFFDRILSVANYIFYLGIGITLLLYKKLVPTGSA